MKIRDIITKHQQKKARQNESHLRYVAYKPHQLDSTYRGRRK